MFRNYEELRMPAKIRDLSWIFLYDVGCIFTQLLLCIARMAVFACLSCGSYQPIRLSQNFQEPGAAHVMPFVTLFAWSVCSSAPRTRNDMQKKYRCSLTHARVKYLSLCQHGIDKCFLQLLGRLLCQCLEAFITSVLDLQRRFVWFYCLSPFSSISGGISGGLWRHHAAQLIARYCGNGADSSLQHYGTFLYVMCTLMVHIAYN